jgi:hypothetical protein
MGPADLMPERNQTKTCIEQGQETSDRNGDNACIQEIFCALPRHYPGFFR